MNNEMIERYVYAVTRRMPGKMQRDVSREINSLISDMLEERCRGELPSDKDVRVVLTEIGTPRELYEKYCDDGNKYLIGPGYYSIYVRVMKIVSICAAVGIGVAFIVSFIQNPSGGIILKWLFAMISAQICAFAFVTGLFAVFSIKGVKLDVYDSLDSLPEVPSKNTIITKTEGVLSIVFTILFVIALLVPLFVVVGASEGGGVIPIFNMDVIWIRWIIVILIGAIGVFDGIIKLIEGRYTKRLMISTIVGNSIQALLFMLLFGGQGMLNTQFLEVMGNVFKKTNSIVQVAGENAQYIFLGFIVLMILLDTGTTVYRTLKALKMSKEITAG